MIAWLFRSVVRPSSLLLGAGLLGFEIFYLVQQAGESGTNGWNSVYPAATSASFGVVIALLWWTTILFENAEALQRSEVMIRTGSRARAVVLTARRDIANLMIGLLITVAVSAVVGIIGGPSVFWSPATVVSARTGGPGDIFSTTAAARVFASPLLAIASCVAFSAIAFVCLSIVHSTLVLVGLRRLATVAAIAIYLWSACCSFGVAASFPIFDSVVLFNLSVAQSRGVAGTVIGAWLLLAGICLLAMTWRSARSNARAVAGNAWLLLFVAVVAFMLAVTVPGGPILDRWTSLFAGQDDSLVGYLRVASLLSLVAGVVSVRHADSNDNNYLYSVVRYGSRWRWFRRDLLGSLGFGAAGAFVIVSAALTGLAATSAGLRGIDPGVLLKTLIGALLSSLIVSCLALIATIVGGPRAWFVTVGAILIVGYPAFLPLGDFDVFALYSARFASQPTSLITGAATGGGVLLVSIAALVAVGKGAFIAGRSRTRKWMDARGSN